LSEVSECPRCPMIPGSSVRLSEGSECPRSEASTSECPRNRGHGLYSPPPPLLEPVARKLGLEHGFVVSKRA